MSAADCPASWSPARCISIAFANHAAEVFREAGYSAVALELGCAAAWLEDESTRRTNRRILKVKWAESATTDALAHLLALCPATFVRALFRPAQAVAEGDRWVACFHWDSPGRRAKGAG